MPLHVSQSNVDLYADDSTLHYHDKLIENIDFVLQKDITAIETWCNNNSMKINTQKTKCMRLYAQNKKWQICLNLTSE